MAISEREIIEAYVPDSIKKASRNFQMHKVAEQVTGITDFSLEKIAQHMGEKFAARRLKWRPVADGLIALQQLKG